MITIYKLSRDEVVQAVTDFILKQEKQLNGKEVGIKAEFDQEGATVEVDLGQAQ